MSERTTLARPYAEAVFDLAQEGKALDAWQDALQLAAAVSKDERVAKLIGSPRVPRERLLELFLEVGGSRFTQPVQNFLRVLAANNRLDLLPDIAQLYAERKAEAERSIAVEVVSAYALTDAQLKSVAEALQRRFQRNVQITAQEDPSLIGGMIVRAGDLVIDGSVIGRLRALATSLGR